MNKREFYNRVTNSKEDLIDAFIQLLHEEQIDYCVIGGLAINAYCEPMVTLDLDCVVVIEHIEKLRKRLKGKGFKVRTHPFTWAITHKASDVRIQLR